MLAAAAIVNPSTTRRLFDSGSAVVGLLTASAVAWTAWPVTRAIDDESLLGKRIASLSSDIDGNDATAAQIARWESIWERPLQGKSPRSSSRDPVAAPSEPPPRRTPEAERPRVASPAFGMKLIGTVVERGRSVAIVSDSGGSLGFAGVGETFDLQPGGVQVVRIDDGSATMRYRNKQTTLRIGQLLRPATSLQDSPASGAKSSLLVKEAPVNETSSTPPPAENMPFQKDAMSLEDELELLNGDFDERIFKDD